VLINPDVEASLNEWEEQVQQCEGSRCDSVFSTRATEFLEDLVLNWAYRYIMTLPR